MPFGKGNKTGWNAFTTQRARMCLWLSQGKSNNSIVYLSFRKDGLESAVVLYVSVLSPHDHLESVRFAYYLNLKFKVLWVETLEPSLWLWIVTLPLQPCLLR